MKNFNFSFAIIAVLVMAVISSCTTSREVTDDNFENARQVGNRLYIDDPYRGTVILERDPYTGRYYDITNTIGPGSYSRYNTWNNMNDWNNPYYRNNTYNRNRMGSGTRVVTPPTEEQRKEVQQHREDARRKVLGDRKQ